MQTQTCCAQSARAACEPDSHSARHNLDHSQTLSGDGDCAKSGFSSRGNAFFRSLAGKASALGRCRKKLYATGGGRKKSWGEKKAALKTAGWRPKTCRRFSGRTAHGSAKLCAEIMPLAAWGRTGSSAGTPWSTALGAFAGSAFAARTSLPGPAFGPYHAVLASTAKRNARRQRQMATGTRRKGKQSAIDPDMVQG